ncbi:hypothetical protein DPMN_118605 [Dreissena polymorpha]|uniref:Uncharacterized protein n=1 Tax=Dreissena polymorpha TaxID=45954 RepID=A0A9D4GKE9_DREPO|nr:hypothetical protein DPMN_118605 [Dreissena polymorpha]
MIKTELSHKVLFYQIKLTIRAVRVLVILNYVPSESKVFEVSELRNVWPSQDTVEEYLLYCLRKNVSIGLLQSNLYPRIRFQARSYSLCETGHGNISTASRPFPPIKVGHFSVADTYVFFGQITYTEKE